TGSGRSPDGISTGSGTSSSSGASSLRRAAWARSAGCRCSSASPGRTVATRRSTWSTRRAGGVRWLPSVLPNWFQPVPDPVARLDERMAGRAAVDLVAQSTHEDVDGAVAVRLTAAPDLLQQLVAGDDTAALEGQLIEQPELRWSQARALAVDEGLHLSWVDAELLDLDRVASLGVVAAECSSRRCAYASNQLVHRERLDQVVVRSDLQRVHAVVLGAPGADDDDRSRDPFGSSALDDAPTVTAGEHQVEDANIRALEAEAGEPLV